jgi:hypothetical protein
MDAQNKFDEELILSFIFQFNQFERALRKAGFTKSGQPTEADWLPFILKVDKDFDIKADAALEMAVDYILVSRAQSGKPIPMRDTAFLADQIQGLGKRLGRSIHFRTPTTEDDEMMMAAMVIMAAWHEFL